MSYNFPQPTGSVLAASDVAAPAAQTSAAQAALTQAAAAINPPTKIEYDKTVVDAAAARTVVNQLVTDMTNLRGSVASILTALKAAGIMS